MSPESKEPAVKKKIAIPVARFRVAGVLNFLRKSPREEPFHDSHIPFPFSSLVFSLSVLPLPLSHLCFFSFSFYVVAIIFVSLLIPFVIVARVAF